MRADPVGPPTPNVGGQVRVRYLVLAGLFAVVVNAVASRRFFLFWDDYVFLGQARSEPFGRAYLVLNLFSHFSPLTRVQMKGILHLLEIDRSLVYWYMVGLHLFVVASIAVLMVVLHGRTVRAVVGILLTGTSLSLLPATNWVTGGLNLLPALGLTALALATAVLYVRTRRLLWCALSVLAYGVGVLDYEIAILIPLYVGVWVLLFGHRQSADRIGRILLGTWALWAGYVVIGLASVLNYRANYYSPAPGVSIPQILESLRISLLEALLPSFLGIHDPSNQTLTNVGAVVSGGLAIGLVWWTVQRSRAAWWAWGFAVLGWLVPTLALVVNRAGLFGVGVASNLVYYPFATLLVVVGALEAVASATAPGRPVDPGAAHRTVIGTTSPRVRAVAGAVALALVATAYVTSVVPAMKQQSVATPARNFVGSVVSGLEDLRAHGPFTVLDTDVPSSLVPAEFAPYNRLGNVLAVSGVDVQLDDVSGPLYVADGQGDLRRASYDALATVPAADASAPGRVLIDGAKAHRRGDAKCFRAGPSTQLRMAIPAPVTGASLVVRALIDVDRRSSLQMRVADTGLERWVAVPDPGPLLPGRVGVYASTAVSSSDSVLLSNFTPGTRVCARTISLGVVATGASPTG
jgi:hypothetical protein